MLSSKTKMASMMLAVSLGSIVITVLHIEHVIDNSGFWWFCIAWGIAVGTVHGLWPTE